MSSCQDLWKFLPANQGGELGGSTLRGGSLSSCEAAVDEAFPGEQQTELVASIEGAPVGAQAQHQLEDQVESVLADLHPLGGVGAQPHPSEDRLKGIGGAQVGPVLLRIIVEGDEVLPVALQAVRRVLLPLGSQLGAVLGP